MEIPDPSIELLGHRVDGSSLDRYLSVPVSEARGGIGPLLERILFDRLRVVLTRHGRRIAGLVPIHEMLRLEALDVEVDKRLLERSQKVIKSGEPKRSAVEMLKALPDDEPEAFVQYGLADEEHARRQPTGMDLLKQVLEQELSKSIEDFASSEKIGTLSKFQPFVREAVSVAVDKCIANQQMIAQGDVVRKNLIQDHLSTR